MSKNKLQTICLIFIVMVFLLLKFTTASAVTECMGDVPDFKNDDYNPIVKTRIEYILSQDESDNSADNVVENDDGSPMIKKIESIESLDWFSYDASKILDKKDGPWKRATSAIIIDVETGLFFKGSRNGGFSHCDFEPETKEDTAILKRIYGGKWSWDRRPVIIQIDGHSYAASINGMPHQGNRIPGNNFNGHICLHFLHSTLHVNGEEDKKHQEAIDIALNTSVDELQERINNNLKGD